MTSRRVVIQLFVLIGLLAACDASAQNQGVVDRFPTPQRVLRDFGDDASRRAALEILYYVLQEQTPTPRSRAASERITAYFRALGEVDLPYVKQGANSAARSVCGIVWTHTELYLSRSVAL